MSTRQPSALEVKVDYIQEDIKGIKGTIKDFAESMKVMSDAMISLTRQEEKVTAICLRVDKVEKSQDSIWKEVRDIKSTCQSREQYVSWTKRMQEEPKPVAPDVWWNSRVSKNVSAMVWIILGYVVAVLARKAGF